MTLEEDFKELLNRKQKTGDYKRRMLYYPADVEEIIQLLGKRYIDIEKVRDIIAKCIDMHDDNCEEGYLCANCSLNEKLRID